MPHQTALKNVSEWERATPQALLHRAYSHCIQLPVQAPCERTDDDVDGVKVGRGAVGVALRVKPGDGPDVKHTVPAASEGQPPGRGGHYLQENWMR